MDPIDVEDAINRATALCALVPARITSADTKKAYWRTFRRMWNDKDLDPLRTGIALNTYYCRRAALHCSGKIALQELISQCRLSAENPERQQDWARKLLVVVSRLEPLFALDPPMQPDVLPWERPPSRWSRSENDRERGAASKKHVLQDLPEDWDRRLWEATPDDWKHREPLAVHLVVPVRPEELVPGQRPSGWSQGVTIELRAESCMALTFVPVKSHNGLFGTERTEICVDPVVLGGPAQFLAERCAASSGLIVVSTVSKNAVRKALADLGAKALPEIGDIAITPYVCRHQLLADLKATFGAGGTVAAAGGHCSDRMQSKYGYVQHGRKRKGYISICARRPPRCGNVERARQISGRNVLRRTRL